MKQIIKHLTLIIAGGALALSFGCGIEGLIKDLRDELKDDVGFAPASLDGVTLNATITSGTGDNAATGSFTISFTSTTYNRVDTGGTVGPDTGTYVYTKTAINQAILAVNSSDGDAAGTATLTFTSAITGSYAFVNTLGDPGTQTGTFTMNYAVPPPIVVPPVPGGIIVGSIIVITKASFHTTGAAWYDYGDCPWAMNYAVPPPIVAPIDPNFS